MARSFDGVDDKIDFGDANEWDVDLGSVMTLSMWILPANLTQVAGMVNKRLAYKNNSSFSFGFNYDLSSKFYFDKGDDSGGDVLTEYHCPNTGWSTTTWDHIAVLVDLGAGAGLKVKVYRNAVAQTMTAVSDTGGGSFFNKTSNLILGIVNENSPLYYNGKLAEVGIWKSILTTDEITALSKGASPNFIRRDQLQFLSPLWAVASPEPNLSGKGNRNGTVTGAVLADHAPVGRYAPSRLSRVFPATVGAGPAPTAFFQHSGPLRVYRKNRR